MSIEQAELGEFDTSNQSNCDRPRCTRQTIDGNQCKNPVIPVEGIEVCTLHFGESDNSDCNDRPVWERQSDELIGDSE